MLTPARSISSLPSSRVSSTHTTLVSRSSRAVNGAALVAAAAVSSCGLNGAIGTFRSS